MSAGWRFSRDHGGWMPLEAAAAPAAPTGRALHLATFNCLHDHSQPELLQHAVRHEAICRELLALDADVIGLNEVTRALLERVLGEPWVRDSYTVSVLPDDPRCAHLSATRAGGFGNMLLSRIRPAAVEYVEQLRGEHESHVFSFDLCDPHGGARPLRIAVCSTHLIALPWLMEGRRKAQLEHLTTHLTSARTSRGGGSGFDACVVMGDCNFHREAENASIPRGWREVPAVVALGETWDMGRNRMLPHYLPLRNIYNGFGLGASYGWPSPMRLDRVLVHQAHRTALDYESESAAARIFADQPIDERARGRPPLPPTGPELREAHRALPWQEYLFPSDHFGIFVELPLVCQDPPQ